MRKCEICGIEEEGRGTDDAVGVSHLHLCESCQNDRKLHLLVDILK
ncbi:hypothetical protein [Peribacillus cavernae]|nr:hypothetical protein [Peribacillus cavernae]MDQ0220628.1 ribosome-binding protein aMBF1 (putative translation factor) [Peribacillus cavernae]